MNDLGFALIGLVVRATVFAAVGLAIAWVLRRRGPAASATVALATLVGLVGISALAASPWPRWWSLGDSEASLTSRAAVATSPAPPDRPDPSAAALPDGADAVVAVARPKAGGDPAGPTITAALRELGRALMRPPAAADSDRWGYLAWLAAIAIAGVSLGLGRFALGIAAVAALRGRSRPVVDEGLLDLARRLRAELAIGGEVALRVAPGLATPATVGWLRPAILLPEDWTGWDDRERQVVLSHELAHIRRNDYLAGLWAQLSLALHYYHPLAHWLARRLRLEQELAADAWGARLSGGNRPYLAALARMALRNDPRPVGWPARSFRPARGTFLRRIEMLRDANELQTSPLPRPTRAIAIGALILAGLALAGLRGPGSTPMVGASPLRPQISATLEHGYIPAETALIAVIRPADLLTNPRFKGILDAFDPQHGMQVSLGIAPEEIEQVTVVQVHGPGLPEPVGGPIVQPSGTILRSTVPKDWKATIAKLVAEPKEAKSGDFAYSRPANGPGLSAASPDDRTLIVAHESVLVRMLAAKPGAADKAKWAEAWKSVKKGQVAIAVDATYFFDRLGLEKPPPGQGPLGVFAPLVEKVEVYAVGIEAGEKIAVDGVAVCRTDAGTPQVADTIRAGIALGKNALDSYKAQLPQAPPEMVKLAMLWVDTGTQLLDRATVKVDGRTIRVASSSDLQVAEVIKGIAPAVQAARASGRRAQSTNNMKQIGLALHNYANTNGHFPAAVVIGPDGKTPHSWRVAILPYIEQQKLYDAYKLDEPWDGPNNRKLLALMPAMYRHPSNLDAAGDSPSYFTLTGKETLFPGTEGVKFTQITDGLSNTIAIVEAQRTIPWTKPEDIPFDPAGPLPKLGIEGENGFNALFADGAVKFLVGTINPVTLKALITKAGGEVITADKF